MKGGVAGGSYSGKRRWKGLVIGVLGLVFLSMLVPLLFLLGLHNGFHPPGYVREQRNSPSIGGYGTKIIINASNLSGGGVSKHVDDLVIWFLAGGPIFLITMNTANPYLRCILSMGVGIWFSYPPRWIRFLVGQGPHATLLHHVKQGHKDPMQQQRDDRVILCG